VEIYKKAKDAKDQTTQDGGGKPNPGEDWDLTTAKEAKELVSKCKNLFGK